MKLFGRFVNPLVAFIGVQLAWILVVVVWIRWFLGRHRQLRALAEKYSPELVQEGLDWLILVEGLVLLVAILGGVYVIFIYWRRQSALNREQRKFISQVSHELKSPLASLQLHLETIRLRQPPPEKMQKFVNTMLQDTSRLDGLINNLLTANRMELRGPRLLLHEGDLSSFLEDYLETRGPALPPQGQLETDIEPGLHCRFNPEAMETVLRNLIENAILYSNESPQIRISLVAENNSCRLSVADQGRGIEPAEQKKIFRMFYRSRRGGDRVPGTGLGLFIVRALVKRQKGKVRVESPGAGRGTTFHITLPRTPAPEERA